MNPRSAHAHRHTSQPRSPPREVKARNTVSGGTSTYRERTSRRTPSRSSNSNVSSSFRASLHRVFTFRSSTRNRASFTASA